MKRIILYLICFLFSVSFVQAGDEVLNKQIHLTKFKGTSYEALKLISDISGFLFVYDSNLIDNNLKVKMNEGDVTLQQAILNATQMNHLLLKVIDNHILLYKKGDVSPEKQVQRTILKTTIQDSTSFFVIDGVVRDKENKASLSNASVSLLASSIGSVTNQNGEFQLKIPDSLRNSSIRISYMGYITRSIPVQLLAETGNKADIYLDVSVIPIQEVIVKMVNPEKIIREMLENRGENCSNNPVYFTVYYREGVDYKNGFANLTEAVFKVYKSGFRSTETDNIKLLKKRKISSSERTDSLILKMKAGISASLSLDIVKDLPDFLVMDNENPYVYSKIDMTEIDSSLAHVIAFEQKKESKLPLYKGELYIHSENSALLNAHFEIDPRGLQNAKEMFVVKQTKGLDITPKRVEYNVSYKEWNGKYYPNYFRGDLSFEVKKKKNFWNRASTIHTYFEMVICKIDTENVKRFPNKETIPDKNVFSDIYFSYDPVFWEEFNIIPPEEKLNKEIGKIKTKIEESLE